MIKRQYNRASTSEMRRRMETHQDALETHSAVLTVSIPEDLKIWALEASQGRKIPVSWLVAEALREKKQREAKNG